MALTYTRRIELMPSKAVTTIDLSHVVFDELERAAYDQRRKTARHVSRTDLEHIHWMLQLSPMQDERCYLYRDQLIVSMGGWWTCVLPDMGFSHMQDGTMTGMMDRIDEAISSKLAKDAVDAVIRRYAGCVTQDALRKKRNLSFRLTSLARCGTLLPMKTSEFEIKSCTEIGRRIEQFYKHHVLDGYNKALEQLIEQAAQNPRHALEWLVEDMLVKHCADIVWRRTVASVREAVTDFQAQYAVMNHVTEVAKHVLRFPPRHCSTGEVSNLSTLAENQARCEFVQKASEIAGDLTYAS